MANVLITGANGQIGTELVSELSRSDENRVVSLDLNSRPDANGSSAVQHEIADVRNRDRLSQIVRSHDIDTVYHLASLLSAAGEKAPDRTWEVNMYGLKHILDLAKEHDLKIFWPSSIAVFGPHTPAENVPQHTVLEPSTMYGVTKVSGELLCQYYHERFGVDVRSLRYPGLISYKAPPGGGTTDYAVDVFYSAVKGEPFTCFLRPDTRLPMMYMPDATRAALDLMAANPDAVSIRTSYNIGALSFSARELMDALADRIPTFEYHFEPDERQEIADTWPASVDDNQARSDWNWQPEYSLAEMVDDMLTNLQDREAASPSA